MTQHCSAVQPTSRAATAATARSTALRRVARALARAVARLYADRPITSLGTPGYAGELPEQRYAELAVLRRR